MEYFDDIVCISLKHRADRRQHMDATMRRLDIPFRYHIAESHPKGGMYGCFASHMEVIHHCFAKGMQNVLIFEDDILPTPSYSIQHIQHAVSFMKTHPHWDMFYFGYFAFNTNPKDLLVTAASTSSTHIIRYRPLAAHAYCVNRPAMERILRSYAPHIGKLHVDIFYSKLGLHSYCYVPMLFEQKMCMPSDIPAYNVAEHALRSVSCIGERHQLNHKMSIGAFWMQKHINTVIFIMIAMIICLVVLFGRKWSFGK